MVALGELRGFIACVFRGGAPKPVELVPPEPPKALPPEPIEVPAQEHKEESHAQPMEHTVAAEWIDHRVFETTSAAYVRGLSGYSGAGVYPADRSVYGSSASGVFIRRGKKVYKLAGIIE